MSTFLLTMYRPNKLFFEGQVSSLLVSQPDRQVEILPGHIPMIMQLGTDMARLALPDGQARVFATGEGVLHITPAGVMVLSDFLVWEERLEAALDNRRKSIEAENRRRKQSALEYRLNQIEMSRLFTRLSGRRH
ncbi:MAG: hypothetical protein WDA00_06830 [Eubacteriales bacterium]